MIARDSKLDEQAVSIGTGSGPATHLKRFARDDRVKRRHEGRCLVEFVSEV